ncbi:MAG: aminopeptidase [bacterium]|nr:aminopeptidase [bacterium]
MAFLGLDLDVGYYLHLVKGQANLLWNREPIERVLKQPDLDPEIRKRLLFIQEVKTFAQQQIGLVPSQIYSSFVDLHGQPVSWNLAACPKDRLDPVRWSYPVVGSAPYRGYFDLKRAKKERDALEAKGYDTYLRPVSAYSTLGWFSDPILSSMLQYRDADLAGLVIHEMTHVMVWIPGDVNFNESLASFVGDAGAILFLKSKFGPDAQVVRDVLMGAEDNRVFRRFMKAFAASLDSLYATDLTFEEKIQEREVVFEQAKERFQTLPLKTKAYRNFLNWKMNNARMVLHRIYNEEVTLFEQVYEALDRDLIGSLDVFMGCEDAGDPSAYLEDWLKKKGDIP